jgi:hypothetical protein
LKGLPAGRWFEKQPGISYHYPVDSTVRFGAACSATRTFSAAGAPRGGYPMRYQALMVVVLASGLVAPLSGADGPTSRPIWPSNADRTRAASVAAGATEAIESNLRDLGSPHYRIREQAMAALMDAGPAAYPLLKRAFDERATFDFRRRIKQIAQEIYLTETVSPPKAFLGISHLGRSARSTDDARIPGWGTALLITDVFIGSSAELAGIRRGDVVMMMDGRPAIGEYVATNITEQIGRRRPGDPCELGLIRGGQGLVLRDGDTEGFSAADLAKCRYEQVGPEDDARVLPGTIALKLLDVKPLGEKSPAQAGDLLIALDDEPLKADAADGGLAEWAAKGPRPLSKEVLDLLPAQRGPVVRQRMRGTAQILRGGQWVTMTVRLGRWPTYLNDWLLRSRNLDVQAATTAMSGFEEWWQATFDPSGAFSIRADGDPRWRMQPPGAAE